MKEKRILTLKQAKLVGDGVVDFRSVVQADGAVEVSLRVEAA